MAEMAGAFVCASLQITPTVRHADYVAGWLDVLREDKRAIFRAASMASKAADFILACGETGKQSVRRIDSPPNADQQQAAAE